MSFGEFKPEFLDKVERAVAFHVESQDENCLGVLEKTTPPRYHYPNLDNPIDFCKILYKFMRKKRYNGHELDSTLTEPLIDIVVTKYEELYDDHSEELAQALLDKFVEDSVIRTAFCKIVADEVLDKVNQKVRGKIANAMSTQLHRAASSHVGHVVGHSISVIAGTVVGQQIGVLILKFVALHIKTIVIHILTSSVIKTMIVSYIKHHLYLAISAAIMHFLASHFGAATASSIVGWAAFPIMAGVILYQVTTFPKKLGRALGKKVREVLDHNFESINDKIISNLEKKVLDPGALASAIAGNDEFSAAVKQAYADYLYASKL